MQWDRSGLKTVLIAGSLIALPGCLGQGDSGSNDPGDFDPEDPVQVAEIDAMSGISGMAVDLVSAVLEQLPEWTQGFDETPTRDTSVQWDSVEQVWILTGTETYNEPDVTGTATFHTTVQFLAGGVAIQNPDETMDQVEVAQRVSNAGLYDPGDFQLEFDLEVDHTMSFAAGPGGDVSATGGGGISGTAITHVDGLSHDSEPTLGWTVSLNLGDQGGCGSGLVSGSSDDDLYTFFAEFSGDGSVDFILYRDGRTMEEDTKNYDCSGFGDNDTLAVVKLEVIGAEAVEQASLLMQHGARWLTGDLGAPDPGTGRDATVPSWDPVDEQWSWQETLSDGTRQWDADIRVKYFAFDQVQQNPDQNTDTMDVDIFVHVVGSEDRGTDGIITWDLELDSQFQITDVAALPYSASGGGNVRGSIGIPEGNDFGADAVLNVDGSVTSSGCPNGGLTAAIGDWRFDATFDGFGGLDWEVLDESGARTSWSTMSLGCTGI